MHAVINIIKLVKIVFRFEIPYLVSGTYFVNFYLNCTNY